MCWCSAPPRIVHACCCVAVLPAGASIGMPDLHSGYGFAIGNVAAVDMDDPKAVVSPGGVGFDVNCGVRQLAPAKPVYLFQLGVICSCRI